MSGLRRAARNAFANAASYCGAGARNTRSCIPQFVEDAGKALQQSPPHHNDAQRVVTLNRKCAR